MKHRTKRRTMKVSSTNNLLFNGTKKSIAMKSRKDDDNNNKNIKNSNDIGGARKAKAENESRQLHSDSECDNTSQQGEGGGESSRRRARRSPRRSRSVDTSKTTRQKEAETLTNAPSASVPASTATIKGKKYTSQNNSKAKQEQSSSPKRQLSLSSIGKRWTERFSEKRKNPQKIQENLEEIDEMDQVEDDPVMTIFESRNTQRVRFSIEGLDMPQERDDIPERSSSANIKQFMSKAIFGASNGSKAQKRLTEEMEEEVAKELSLVWESATTPTGPEVIHTTTGPKSSGPELTLSFTEDPKARAMVSRLLYKANRAENIHFRYEYAVKCYVKALNILSKANYPNGHPTVQKTMQLLNNSHHVLSSYNNSANIVKMGIKYEDSGELVRALKMYTIAYRIRRDNLNRNHPSLAVLLNMLGSIQIKRGELKEAMQIYELALKDSPIEFTADGGDEWDTEQEMQPPPTTNLLAKSVTYREMGTIHERWGNVQEALSFYHKSLECVAEWKRAIRGDDGTARAERLSHVSSTSLECPLDHIKLSKSTIPVGGNNLDTEMEKGEMELFFGKERRATPGSEEKTFYELFFPPHLDKELDNRHRKLLSGRDAYADMDLALTLHQIAQLYRSQGDYSKSLDAYEVALRGMKYALGRYHPNVAAVLGNIGNLQKDMGDMDAAYNTYQEVLGIESYRLGLSHPDVAITLHNIATIDAARGNYVHALTLYQKVLGLQKKLKGEDHLSVSVTSACMGEVYERIGQLQHAMESFEEAVRIKSAILGRHSLEASRLLHKLGKISFRRGEYLMAESFLSRAVLIYGMNKLGEGHEWVIEGYRDKADVEAAITMGEGRHFEC